MSMPGPPDLSMSLAPSVESLDHQFQTIDTIERNWALPALPNEVKVDLLGMQELPDAQAQSEFLTGLAADLKESVAPPPDPAMSIPAQPGAGLTTPGVVQSEDAFVQEIRRQFAGIASVRQPQILVGDKDYGVRSIKREMAIAGLIPENDPLDGSWSPQYAAARRQYLNDEAGRRIEGERPGAMSAARAFELMDEWLSPTSLMASAIGLDVIDDAAEGAKTFFGAVGDFIKDPSLDTAVGIGGAIDDIAIPIMNTYLVYSGFRSVLMFGNALRLGANAAGGASALGKSSRPRFPLASASKRV